MTATTLRGAPLSDARTARPGGVDKEARARTRLHSLQKLDWTLLLAVMALCLVGGVLVWSASAPAVVGGADPYTYFKRHVLNMTIGLVLAAVTSLFDYRSLRAYAPLVYALSIVGLIAVLTPVGTTINGSHSWLILPAGFSLQPAELAKVGLVVVLAMLLAERRDAIASDGASCDGPRSVDVALALAVGALPTALVLLQPDLGSALVIGALIVGVVIVSGASWRWIVGLAGSAALAVFVAIQIHVLESYQLDRFTAFLDPGADLQGAGYNVRQAQIAIGSGGLNGQGLFNGSQTQGRFVPEQRTDFIFTVAGEELGFLGAAAIVALFALVLWRIGRVAVAAEDQFGRLVACGVLCWFAFQAFENIGMTLGILPVTGLPLPFVSYGGSSMFASLLGMALVQNVHTRQTRPCG